MTQDIGDKYKQVVSLFRNSATMYEKQQDEYARAEHTYQHVAKTLTDTQHEFTQFLQSAVSLSPGSYEPLPNSQETDTQSVSIIKLSIPTFHFPALTLVIDKYVQPHYELRRQTEQRIKADQTVQQRIAHLRKMHGIVATAISSLPPHIKDQITWLYTPNHHTSSVYHILHKLLSNPQYQLTDDAICSVVGAQVVPIPPLVDFIRPHVHAHNYHGHKLLDHLRTLTASVTSPVHDTLFHAMLAVIRRIIDAPYTVTDQQLAELADAVKALHDAQVAWPTATTVEAHHMTWPFQPVTNTYVADPTKTLLNHRPAFTDTRLSVTYSFVPDRTLANNDLPAEDMLWFDAVDADHFCAIVADGASQSALGGVAARAICTNLSRLYVHHRHNGGGIPSKADIEHTFALAKWDGNALLDQEITSVPTYMRTSIERKREEFGSQTVVSMVVRHAEQLLVTWVGNVRVIVPGLLDAHSTRFNSDHARFTSNIGLLGDLAYVVRPKYVVANLQILIHSDALEKLHPDALKRYELLQVITDEQLMECAKSDDTTVIDIRVKAV